MNYSSLIEGKTNINIRPVRVVILWYDVYWYYVQCNFLRHDAMKHLHWCELRFSDNWKRMKKSCVDSVHNIYQIKMQSILQLAR